MVAYREAGIELVQARGQEGRFTWNDEQMRLGLFSEAETWYVGVHRSSGGFVARLSLEEARTLKEAKDMLLYGFFLELEGNVELLRQLDAVGLLVAPDLPEA